MIIDFITDEPIVCECGEAENLSIATFVFGSQVHCETCGNVVRP